MVRSVLQVARYTNIHFRHGVHIPGKLKYPAALWSPELPDIANFTVVNKHPARHKILCYNINQVFTTTSTKVRHWTLSSATRKHLTLVKYFCNINFNIIIWSMRMSPKAYRPFRSFRRALCMRFTMSYACHMSLLAQYLTILGADYKYATTHDTWIWSSHSCEY